MSFRDLFIPKQPRPFLTSTLPGAGEVRYATTPGPDPNTAPFIQDGRFFYHAGGMVPVGEASAYGDSSREFYPDQIIGNRRALPLPTLRPPAWGSFLYGIYDAANDSYDNSSGITYDPVLPGDYIDFPADPDLQQMYFVTPADYQAVGEG